MKFIESICYKNRRYLNLENHQLRVNRTFANFFQGKSMQLDRVLPQIEEDKTYKVRVVYDEEMADVEFSEYYPRSIRSLALVKSDLFDYSYKYEDRSMINRLTDSTEEDDIIISIDGLIRDSSYANLAFWTGTEWVTPEDPLLCGTKRELLINQKKIITAPIQESDLSSFEKVAFINSMLDLGNVELQITDIKMSIQIGGPGTPD
ncbi:MAG: aminotransferase class IV [Cyclobacteriaceae bacterium]